jgi:hypothetical protein
LRLLALEPWTLDRVEQELEKLQIADLSEEVIAGVGSGLAHTEAFLNHFFSRQREKVLPWANYFADHPEESLPLLGLLGWNVRHLALVLADRERGTRHVRLSPFLMERFRKWSEPWKLPEILSLQHDLFEVDYSLKQTRLIPLGVWGSLLMRYCRH